MPSFLNDTQLQVDNIVNGAGTGSPTFPQGLSSSAPIIFPNGSASAPSIRFAPESGLGLFRKAANSLGVAANSAEVASVASTGAWTIGLVSAIGGSTYPGSLIVGKTDGSTVPAGYVGEVISQSRLYATPLDFTAGSPSPVLNIVSITLTPGYWEVSGFMGFRGTTTSASSFIASISTTSGVIASADDSCIEDGVTRNINADDWQTPIPTYFLNTSSSVTLYLTARATFVTGTLRGYGRIQAKRVM